MSKFLQPPPYSTKALEKQWLNNVWSSHDLICGCPTPIDHLNHIYKQGCLSSNDPGAQDGGIEALVDAITEKDLENIFTEENAVQDDDG